MREYAESLEAGGCPKAQRLYQRPDTGQWVADVFPSGLESLLFGGFRGEIWIRPGSEPTQGRTYRDPDASPAGVGLVLGAGNQTPVTALDILHVLVVGNQVVVCKMNPVLEYLGPYLRRAFQPLVDEGFLEFVYGGGEVGAVLCNHPLVASVHLTGSSSTYDAIVWKGQPKVGSPPFTKPVSAELGCVTPYIVVPGRWSESDLEYHAETVATGLTQNAGHNCLKAEILVTDKDWAQRDAFLAALRKKLAATPNRVAFYPGSGHKAAAFKTKFPDAEEIGNGTVLGVDGALVAAPASPEYDHVDVRAIPWLLKTGLLPEEAATQDENWCGVLQEVAIVGCGGDAGAFLPAAVNFANEKCWGTLSCVVIAHPKTQKAHKDAFEAAIAHLHYGTVCVNVPGTLGFAITKLGWGGWPGTSPDDIGSGNCTVHNTMLFDEVEKSVLRGPWRFHPKPFWLTSHRNGEAVGRLSLAFMAKPSFGAILPLAAQAVLG